MKRLTTLLMLLIALTIGSQHVYAQNVTITLNPGWTWISYTRADTLDIATALGTFTPTEGDIIKSQYALTEYHNGVWTGSMTQFVPGLGYMYKSNRSMPVMLTFNAQQPASQVVVTTSEPTDITMISATCGGNVTSINGDYVSVTLRGICWSTNPNPTFNDNYIEAGNGLGSFTVPMTELTPNTSFYVRAFAVTPTETIYGEEMSFTTIDEPDYVDLGLPSGTLWAICNVGSDSPEQYGDYFAWGETQPKNFYYWSTYQYCNGNWDQLTKYCNNPNQGYNGFTDNIITLQFSDDAAMANWGNNWRMPTLEEWQELYNNITHTWITQNGVNGYLFTASNGNSLFLPAAGYRDESGLYDTGSYGSYWSSSLCTDYPSRATCVFYNSDHLNMINDERCRGMSIRPVRSATQNPPLIINATANPAEGGEVSGGGSYEAGAECTLTATANEDYTFTSWTENDSVVSTDAIYTFIVTESRNLVANFDTISSLNVYAWPVYGSSDSDYIDLTQLTASDIKSKPHVSIPETQVDNTYYVTVPAGHSIQYGVARVVVALPAIFNHNTPQPQGPTRGQDGFFMFRSSNPMNAGDWSESTIQIDGVNYILVQSVKTGVYTSNVEFFFGDISSSDTMSYIDSRAIEIDISSMTGQ